jgi:hypothetical protein
MPPIRNVIWDQIPISVGYISSPRIITLASSKNSVVLLFTTGNHGENSRKGEKKDKEEKREEGVYSNKSSATAPLPYS